MPASDHPDGGLAPADRVAGAKRSPMTTHRG
jgi:hypothetical protein